MNLVPDIQREIYKKGIDDIHTTFCRNITCYHHSNQIINSLSSDFDAGYDNNKKNDVTYSLETGVFCARIKYIDKQDKEFLLALKLQDKIEITLETQLVRIKVKKADAQFIHDSVKINIDNLDFRIVTSAFNHGLFDIDYSTFYLRSL